MLSYLNSAKNTRSTLLATRQQKLTGLHENSVVDCKHSSLKSLLQCADLPPSHNDHSPLNAQKITDVANQLITFYRPAAPLLSENNFFQSDMFDKDSIVRVQKAVNMPVYKNDTVTDAEVSSC